METDVDDFESQYAEELEMMKEENGECRLLVWQISSPPSTLDTPPSLPRGSSYGSTLSTSLGPAQPLSAFQKEAFARKSAAHGHL